MLSFLKKKENKEIILGAVAEGELIKLQDVPDPVFSQKMMGDGIALRIKSGDICAPVDGSITLIAETKHAFGMTGADGVEIMVHVGLETVNLKGTGFTPLVKIGDRVKRGTPVLRVDYAVMKEHHIELITPIIVLNHQQFSITELYHNRVVQVNDDLLKLTKVQ